MHADLIELLTSRTGQDFDGECHLTEEEARDIIDALASLSSPQEPIGYVHPEDITEMKEFGRCYIWKSPVKNGYPLFASPVVPVAAKAEAEGWRPIETAPKDSKARLVWVPENQCTYCVSWQSADGPSHPAGWSIFGGGWRSMVQGATRWRPLPAAPTWEGEGT